MLFVILLDDVLVQEGGPMSSVLMSTEVPVVEQQYCIDSYGLQITPTMMCAGYPLGQYDACAVSTVPYIPKRQSSLSVTQKY